MELKIRINEDCNFVASLKRSLKNNNGHCPCNLEKIPDTKCPCREFREQESVGWCRCGLYEKVEVE